jgi:hypothetical protein
MLRRLAPIALLAALAGCAGAPGGDLMSFSLGEPGPRTRALEAPIAPVAKPVAAEFAAFEAVDLLTGKPLRFGMRLRGGELRATESDGCTWTRAMDWFAPSVAWDKCGDSSRWAKGTARVKVLDRLYPIEPGAKGVYERYAVSHRGDDYTRKTTCSVGKPVAVIGQSGKRMPAHVVSCDDGKRTRVTWYAPGVGPVAFVQRHEDKGVEEAWQRVF